MLERVDTEWDCWCCFTGSENITTGYMSGMVCCPAFPKLVAQGTSKCQARSFWWLCWSWHQDRQECGCITRAPNLAELADSLLKLEVIISIYFKFLNLYLLLTHVPLPWNKTQHSNRVVCSWSTWKSCIQRIEECLSGWHSLHCETLHLNCHQQLL
jgi:hypothetical protein